MTEKEASPADRPPRSVRPAGLDLALTWMVEAVRTALFPGKSRHFPSVWFGCRSGAREELIPRGPGRWEAGTRGGPVGALAGGWTPTWGEGLHADEHPSPRSFSRALGVTDKQRPCFREHPASKWLWAGRGHGPPLGGHCLQLVTTAVTSSALALNSPRAHRDWRQLLLEAGTARAWLVDREVMVQLPVRARARWQARPHGTGSLALSERRAPSDPGAPV